MTRAGKFLREYLRRDWLEIFLTILGLLFLGLAVVCVIIVVVIAVTFGDPAPDLPIGRGLLQNSKGYGLAVFGTGAVVTFGVGWLFAGEAIRGRVRALRRGRER